MVFRSIIETPTNIHNVLSLIHKKTEPFRHQNLNTIRSLSRRARGLKLSYHGNGIGYDVRSPACMHNVFYQLHKLDDFCHEVGTIKDFTRMESVYSGDDFIRGDHLEVTIDFQIHRGRTAWIVKIEISRDHKSGGREKYFELEMRDGVIVLARYKPGKCIRSNVVVNKQRLTSPQFFNILTTRAQDEISRTLKHAVGKCFRRANSNNE